MKIEIMSFNDYNTEISKLNEDVMADKEYIILSDVKDPNNNTILLYLNKDSILSKYAEAVIPQNIDIKSGNRVRMKFVFDELGKNKSYSIYKKYLKDIIETNTKVDDVILAKKIISDIDSKVKEMVDFDIYSSGINRIKRAIGDTVM